MRSDWRFWQAFARGGALGQVICAPVMVVIGLVWWLPLLAMLGVAAFGVGLWILWQEARDGD